MPREVSLEAEEWYVLCNWLAARENRLMYALRPRSAEWEFVHELRRAIEDQRRDAEDQRGDAAATSGAVLTVRLTGEQVSYLSAFLRRRSRRLWFLPWRDRERRDVRHLRHQLPDARP